jgi:hypothetical protein
MGGFHGCDYEVCRLLGCYACGSYKNRRFDGTCHLFLRNVLRLIVTANVVHSSPIIDTVMMKDVRFSETSVLTRATLQPEIVFNIQENMECILSVTKSAIYIYSIN